MDKREVVKAIERGIKYWRHCKPDISIYKEIFIADEIMKLNDNSREEGRMEGLKEAIELIRQGINKHSDAMATADTITESIFNQIDKILDNGLSAKALAILKD